VWFSVNYDDGRPARSYDLFANVRISLLFDTNDLRLAVPFDCDFHKTFHVVSVKWATSDGS